MSGGRERISSLCRSIVSAPTSIGRPSWTIRTKTGAAVRAAGAGAAGGLAGGGGVGAADTLAAGSAAGGAVAGPSR